MKLVCIFVMLIINIMKSTENLNVPKTDESHLSDVDYKPSVVGTPYLKQMDLKFGRLTIFGDPIIKITPSGIKTYYTKAICECGTIKEYRKGNLKNGTTKSCGCIRSETTTKKNKTHGLRKSKIHTIWSSMKARCFNPKDKNYSRYGGRGITVCEEWKNYFKSFYDWAMDNGYNENAVRNCQIDRINNDGNYDPSNCRFVTSKENVRNRSNSLKKEDVDEIRMLKETGKYSRIELSNMYSTSIHNISSITSRKTWKD